MLVVIVSVFWILHRAAQLVRDDALEIKMNRLNYIRSSSDTTNDATHRSKEPH